MNLTDEQVIRIREWARQTPHLSDLQTQINATYNLHLTYIEVRFLLDDLGLELKKVESKPTANTNVEQEGELIEEGESGFSVTVDAVTKPGTLINGQVVFSDGQKAAWHLDEMGRLGLKPQQLGYRPSQEDLVRFQEEVQKHLTHLSQSNILKF
ncbi:MAG: hypothetical protein LBB19_02275 [Puniceicoccales bacterium]|jgi:hypothetical protein|nr:hypothetical protein [Puniceicoccales bacterium]